MIYTRAEIRKHWDRYKLFTPESLELNPFFVLYKTEHIAIAIIVAAVFMSELTLPVEDTYYDQEKGLLYMNYSNYRNMDSGAKRAREAMEYIMNADDILTLHEDSCGFDLFRSFNQTNYLAIS